MKKYGSLFRVKFINGLQYRAAALAGMVTQFAWGFMEIFAFAAFYRADPAAFPMEFNQLVSYIWMQQAFLALFFTWFWDSEISSAVESGQIAYELVRPMDLYGKWFCMSAANRLVRAALRCSPILIVAFIVPEPYRMTLPADFATLVLFLLSVALSLCVIVSVTMLMYVTVFHTMSLIGARYIFVTFVDFFAGGIIPLPFFPETLRKVIELSPFGAMQNMPLRIYSGNITGAGAVRGIILQIFWAAALITAGKFYMDRALRKVVVQGG